MVFKGKVIRRGFTAFIFYCLFVPLALAQVQIDGRVFYNQIGLPDVDVKVIDSHGRTIRDNPTLKGGKFKVNLPIGERYTIEFHRDYYVPVKVGFSTVIPEKILDGLTDRERKFKAGLDVSLLAAKKGMDFEVFRKPIKQFVFQKKTLNFEEDKEYTAMVRPGFRKFKQDLDTRYVKAESLKNVVFESRPPKLEKAVEAPNEDRVEDATPVEKTSSSSGGTTVDSAPVPSEVARKLAAEEDKKNQAENLRQKTAYQSELLDQAAREKQTQAKQRLGEEKQQQNSALVQDKLDREALESERRATEAEAKANKAVKTESLRDLQRMAAEEKRRQQQSTSESGKPAP